MNICKSKFKELEISLQDQKKFLISSKEKILFENLQKLSPNLKIQIMKIR